MCPAIAFHPLMPMSSFPNRPSPKRRRHLVVALPMGFALLAAASSASAHDFWLIPDLFAYAGDSTVHVNGRSGTRFPNGAAVQPNRVADAQIIGAFSRTKITEMAVEGTSLRLHQKPTAAGQYLVVASLTPRTTRATPAGLLRYLRAEGGAAEAARLERENAFAGMDSVIYTGTSYAATAVQVGHGGPRAFSLLAGYALELVPLNDPGHLHVGDTLHVRVLAAGQPVSNIEIEAMPAIDSVTASPAPGPAALPADMNGIAHVPLTKAGAWMLRSAYVGHRNGVATNEWDVSRTTYVFGVGGSHSH